MSRLTEIKTNNAIRPVRVLIYGIEGVGKSTFGARAPKPIFISAEGGTDEMFDASGKKVPTMPRITSFKEVGEAVKELLTEKHDYQTVVFDSADWIEKLAHAQIIGATGRSIITANGGYGAGYRESEKLHRELISDISRLREERGMNVVITAHYQVRTVKDPEATMDYDAFEIKCHELVSSLWREWVDCVLFARFRTLMRAGDDEKGTRTMALGDGERVMYTEKRPAFQAKNRYGLPFELPVGWKEFYAARVAGRDAESLDSIKKELSELYMKLKDEETRKVVYQHIEKAGFEIHALIPIRDRLRELTKGVA